MIVLLSLKAPDGTTRFVDQIVRFKPQRETVKFFSWSTALFGSYDVFHVHWPEWIVRHDRLVVRWLKYCAALALIVRIFVTSTPLVRTIHNVVPHAKGGPVERLILAALDRRTTEYILLNPNTHCDGPKTIIRHGHYIEQFDKHPRGSIVPGRILFFGRVEPYKNLIHLIDEFSEIDDDGYSLRIVGALGRSGFQDQGAEILAKVGGTPNVTANFSYVSDSELVSEVSEAQLVVLHYTNMHNSGALLVALSLGCVVYSRTSSVNEWIQHEVGSDWLLLDDTLSAESLIKAVAHAAHLRENTNETPNLRSRDWPEIANQHYNVYIRAARTSVTRSFPWKR